MSPVDQHINLEPQPRQSYCRSESSGHMGPKHRTCWLLATAPPAGLCSPKEVQKHTEYFVEGNFGENKFQKDRFGMTPDAASLVVTFSVVFFFQYTWLSRMVDYSR